MAQWLRVVVDLSEDLGLIPSNALFWPPWAPDTYMVHRHT
ncbi:rCG44826 [Rattus norvegicus]|uniref:RCG44826 n=1 Tax=Rattus norvegicus TaxID=10116 RepID=A6I4U4_RAT|nr:rCG44826 [Rattus norvegicus]